MKFQTTFLSQKELEKDESRGKSLLYHLFLSQYLVDFSHSVFLVYDLMIEITNKNWISLIGLIETLQTNWIYLFWNTRCPTKVV